MELLITTTEDAATLQRRIVLARKLVHKKILVLLTRQNIQLREQVNEDVEWLLMAKTVNELQSLAKQCDAIIAPARREFFESKSVKYILNPEESSRADFMHHRNSGLNQVLLNLCKKTGKEILSSLVQLDGGVNLGRMMQNARFCKKYGVPYHIVSGADNEWQQRSASDIAALQRELLKS